MGNFLRPTKLFVAFSLIGICSYFVWIYASKAADVPDRVVWIVLVSFAIASTILWMDFSSKPK
jgi:hypothetical protein